MTSVDSEATETAEVVVSAEDGCGVCGPGDLHLHLIPCNRGSDHASHIHQPIQFSRRVMTQCSQAVKNKPSS